MPARAPVSDAQRPEPAGRRGLLAAITGVVAVAVAGAGLFASGSPSAAATSAVRNGTDRSLADLNRRLIGLAASSSDRSGPSRSGAVRSLAAQRRALLAPLFTTSPAEAQQLLLPAKTRGQLRGDAADLLEQQTTVSGTYTELAGGAPSHANSYLRQVRTSTRTYTLTSAGTFPPALSGSEIDASGVALGNSLLVEATGGTTSGFSVTSAPSAAAGMTGPMPIAVLLATFTDTTAPPTVAAEQAAFLGHPDGTDVDSWYAEASYGVTSVDPSFFGPFALNETSAAGCANASTLSQTIINAAAPQVTFSSYTRLMFIVDCTNVGGLATVGTTAVSTPQGTITAGESWIGPGGWTDLHTLVHELGHNAGMSHADWIICQPDVFDPPSRLGPNCVAAPYGDPFDVMGQPSATASHPDAYHTALAGWFTAANDPTVTVSGTTTYTLAPIETASAGPVALTIPRGNSGTEWTVEYRQPLGPDAWMSTCGLPAGCNVTEGASIKINGAFPGSPEDTHAIDVTPGSQPAGFTYWPTQDLEIDGALLPGRSFTDPEFGIVVTVTAADASGLTVEVTIPAQACLRAAPTATLPSSTYDVAPGQTLTTPVTITDNDSTGCPAQRFRYQGDGFADPGLVTLNPGATATMTASYTPPSLSYGYYSFAPIIVPDSLSSPPARPFAQVVVSGPADSVPPTTPPYLSAQARGSATVSLHWAPSSDAVGVSGYNVYRDGALLTKSPSNAYVDTAAGGASHSYTVTAVNDAGVESPASLSAPVTLQAATDTTAPSPPSGVTAMSVTDHSVTLRWNEATDNVGVAYYEVEGAPTGPVMVDPVRTSITLSGLQSSIPQTLYVLAFDGAGNQSDFWASYDAGVHPTTAGSGTIAPVAPSPVIITAFGQTHASLSWQPVSDPAGVTGYTVFRNSLRLATVTSSTYTDNGLNSCGNCQYSVQANDASGNTSAPAWSTSVNGGTTDSPSAAITSPSPGTTITSTAAVGVDASAASGVTAVTVYIDGRPLGTTTTSPFAIPLDPQWTSNGSHTLLAVAKDGSNDLGASAPVTVTTSAADTTAPAAPGVVEGFAASPTEIDLQWSSAVDNVGVAEYQVLRDGVPLATTATTTFADTTVAAGSPHTYQLLAADAAGNVSQPSESLAITSFTAAGGSPTPSPAPSPSASPTSTPAPTATPTPAVPGVLRGSVTGTHGSPIANCSVSVTGNGHTYLTATSSSGSFVINGLTPAMYSVTAKMKSTSASASVGVAAGTTSTVSLVLKQSGGGRA